MKIDMKRLLFVIVLLVSCLCAFAEKHEIKAFYVEISESEAKSYGFDETFDDRYFVKTRLQDGLYEVEVGDKLDSKFYAIRFTKFFMLFRYTPFLFKYDEGIIKVTNDLDAGEFIEKD